jgi:mono/diheme cytochrome c family protein
MKGSARRCTLAVCSVLAAFLFLSPAVWGEDKDKETKPDGKTLFEQKCLKCHKPEKFESQHNDRQGWELILNRMERNSCVLTPAELNALADYLTRVHGE